MKGGVLIVLLVLVFPISVSAQVLINEVAWMGTETSANDEWIELYNEHDEAVDLTGWLVRANDDSPTIELEGTIGPGEYFLLERTDDETVPSVSADIIFVGSLANSGEVLKLLDSGGATIDSVNGADDWAIGGNNETKDTLSRVAGVWGTARATPGRANSSTVTPTESSNTTSSKSSTKKKTSRGRNIVYGDEEENSKLKLVSVPKELNVSIGEDRIVTARVPHTFDALVYDQEGKELKETHIQWNFGDGTIGSGKRVTHTFEHAGDYVVFAHATRKKFDDISETSARITVTAQSANVEVTSITDEYLTLTNHENREVDLSGWKLLAGKKYFTVPDHTIILPGASLKLPREVTGLNARNPDNILTFFPSGNLAHPEPKKEPIVVAAQPVAQPLAPRPVVVNEPIEAPPEKLAYPYRVPEPPPQVAAVAGAFTELPQRDREGNLVWWFALFGVIGLASTLVLLRGEQPPKQMAFEAQPESTQLRAEDFVIIDDNDIQKK